MGLASLETRRKTSVEAVIRRNAICYLYNTLNEIQTLEIQPLPCTAAILSASLEFVIRFVSNFCKWCALSLSKMQWKNEVSILINGRVTVNYSVYGRHFVRHLGIYNPICAKLLQTIFGVIPRNLKQTTSVSQTVFLRSTNASSRDRPKLAQ